MNKITPQLLVLNYHEVIADAVAGHSGDPVYSVPLAVFQKQLDILAASGIPVIALDAFESGSTRHPFAVALTFDDGYASDYELVLPELQRHGFSASFFPFTAAIGSPGRIAAPQLRQLAACNHLVGSHGVSHTNFRSLPADEQRRELEQSKQQLEQITGKPVRFFSAPYGWYSTALCRRAQEAGYSGLLTTRYKMNTIGSNAFCIHRLNCRRQTSLKQFADLLHLRGQLPLTGQAVSALKHALRNMLPVQQQGWKNETEQTKDTA